MGDLSLKNTISIERKIFGGITVLAIAAVAAFNMNLNTQKSDLSDLSLANVEALAQSEGGGVNIPCKSEVGKTCEFPCTTADGTTTCFVSNHKNI